MNSTLLQHFSGIQDPKYIKYLEEIKAGVQQLEKSDHTPQKIVQEFYLLEHISQLLEYLLIYTRNIVRMGYSTEEIVEHTNLLYVLFDAIQAQKDSIFTVLLENNVSDVLCKYRHQFNTWKICNSSTDKSTYTEDINDALEQYQAIINNNAGGESLSSLHKLYVNADNSIGKEDIVKRIENGISKYKPEIEKLYVRIKKHQIKLVNNHGYDSPLEYVSDMYSINKDIAYHTLNLTGSPSFSQNSLIHNQYVNSLSDLTSLNKIETKIIDFEDAISIIKGCFGRLDKDFAIMVDRAQKDCWVDHADRESKLEGSYTNIITYTSESMICMTYNGTINDICKLSHEIGHAYHGYCVSHNDFFNTDFSVITAEAFGLFCENYILLYLANNETDTTLKQKYKQEFYRFNIRTFLINLIAFRFEHEAFSILKKCDCSDITAAYCKVLLDLGISPSNAVEENAWIFRSQNFFPENYYYNFVYLIGEVVALSLLQKIMNQEIAFSSIAKLLSESGKETVNGLFSGLGLNLDDKNAFDILNKLDDIWSNLG